jgi:hypothetical protein
VVVKVPRPVWGRLAPDREVNRSRTRAYGSATGTGVAVPARSPRRSRASGWPRQEEPGARVWCPGAEWIAAEVERGAVT